MLYILSRNFPFISESPADEPKGPLQLPYSGRTPRTFPTTLPKRG